MPPQGYANISQFEIKTNNNTHYLLFVETGDGGAGQTFQVKRVNGREDMVFERDYVAGLGIRKLSTYRAELAIRSVSLDCLDEVEEICRNVPRPIAQYNALGGCNCKNWLIDATVALRMSGLVLPPDDQSRKDEPGK